MNYNSPIADTIARINNAQSANLRTVELIYSKSVLELCRILHREGYTGSAREALVGCGGFITLNLRYVPTGQAIRKIKLISKPGRRVYSGYKRIQSPNKFGCLIISSSGGFITDYEARSRKIGGEVVCYVF